MTRQKKNRNSRWEKNRKHWNETLDARNLGAEFEADDFKKEVQLYSTLDVRDGIRFFQPLRDCMVLDFGGGLGLSSYLLLQGDASVVLCDISPRRCEIAKQKLESLGFEGKINCVVASGDALPFRDEAFDRVWTKSVLIHVKLKKTARELARITNTRGGRAWFIEPMRHNPFVNLYRKFMAPGEWKGITTYFSDREYRVLENSFREKISLDSKDPLPAIIERRHYFWSTFFASVFAFLIPRPLLYRIAEKVLVSFDRLLSSVFPRLKNQSWFGVSCIRFPTKRKK